MHRQILRLGVWIAIALGVMAPVIASGVRMDVATLTSVTSRMESRTGVVAIEASDPVAYVASQPDPRSFVVELRDVQSAGFTDRVTADPRNPIAGVRVENTTAADGATIARVRMALTRAGRPRVRSSRNVIYVEMDQADQLAGGAARSAGADANAAVDNNAVADNAQDVTASRTGDRSVPVAAPISALTSRAVVTPKASAGSSAAASLARAQAPAPATSPAATPATTPTATQPANGDAQALAQTLPPFATAPKYTGHPVSLDFQGADLRAVLRTFAEISGLNVVIDSSIQGTVDVALRDVPWDQALDIILRANKLSYVVNGTIVRVVPLAVLADEEAQRRKLAEEQALSGELHVLTRALSYAKAEDMEKLLTATVLSPRGSVQWDTRTNTIILNDLGDRLERASSLLDTLDVPQPQVEIEARIVQTNRIFARQLGVQWGVSGRASGALGNQLPLAFPNQGSITGRTGLGPQGPGAPDPGADAANNIVNLGVQGASSAIGVALGSINGALNLDVALSALESSGQGRILSTPRVSTQNNVEAEITQGLQIPIQTVANNTVTVTFKDAALTLKVTPQITAANTVIMRISVENASPDFSRSVNNIPPIDTQRAVTQVLVSNGDTTVIGGIYVSREQTTEDRTPGLHRIPLLGWLFKRDAVADESRELLIFITPKIMRL